MLSGPRLRRVLYSRCTFVLLEVVGTCKGFLLLTEPPTECGREPRARGFVVGFAYTSVLGPLNRLIQILNNYETLFLIN